MAFNQGPKSDPTQDGDYTVFIPQESGNKRTDEDKYIQSVSIDPGQRNYCMRIERRYYNGPIVTIYYQTSQLREKNVEKKSSDRAGKKTTYVVSVACGNLYSLLLSQIEIIRESHYVVIERQLKVNTPIYSTMDNIIAYMHTLLYNNELGTKIYCISSKMKNLALGKTGSLGKAELKELSTIKGAILLMKRGDHGALEKMFSENEKMDDYGDVVTQNESFSQLMGYPLTKLEKNFVPYSFLLKLMTKYKFGKKPRVMRILRRIHQELEKENLHELLDAPAPESASK